MPVLRSTMISGSTFPPGSKTTISKFHSTDALRLSTIYAFFLELIGLFRLDFGLGTEIHLSAETADDFETRDLLRRIFADSGDRILRSLA